jgi:hypothetical protein
MAYLIAADFKKQIQADNLQAIIGGDNSVLTSAQQGAQEEAITYLVQKYDVTQEFTDTTVWDRAIATYTAGSRVYLDAPAYSATSAYAVNQLALQAGQVYICISLINAPGEAFNAAHWTLLGNQYDVFYGKFPAPLFDLLTFYNKGDLVYWKGKKYTAAYKTSAYDQSTLLQFEETQNVPFQNYFPDDPANGSKQWTTATPYSIPAATLPTNTTYWIKGDNRCQNLVMYIIDIALYHIHSRIAPRNIPDLRIKRYDDALMQLKGYAKGTTTANLPKLQPPTGKRIRFGSHIKNKNSY